MKKIFTYTLTGILIAFLFTSCAKERVVYDDSSYWLSQESGVVIYSSNYCGVYVVETNYGYTIVENLTQTRVYEGDAIYGDFGAYGYREFYNYTAGLITRGNVLEYDMSYQAALDAMYFYCPAGRPEGFNLKKSETSLKKLSRSAAPAKPGK